jgi:hypothetical protein
MTDHDPDGDALVVYFDGVAMDEVAASAVEPRAREGLQGTIDAVGRHAEMSSDADPERWHPSAPGSPVIPGRGEALSLTACASRARGAEDLPARFAHKRGSLVDDAGTG